MRKPYKLKLGQYSEIYDAQSGCCAICGIAANQTVSGRLDVDHCHQTGAVRGLLCIQCNTGLGKYADSPWLLRRAADYLVSHGKAEDISVHGAVLEYRGYRSALVRSVSTSQSTQLS